MTGDDAALLAGLPGIAFAFVLVLARTGAAVMLMPGLGEAEPPPMVRAGIAMALSVLLLPAIMPLLPTMPVSAWQAAGMVLAELLAGFLLGWLARLVALALPMAGQIISAMTGLTSVLAPASDLGAQTTALGKLFALAVPVLVFSSGLYALPISALAGSYHLWPPGHWLPAPDTAQAATGAVADAFGLALRLASPFIIAGIVWQIALGLIARLVPHLQVYFIAMPGQILGGLALLGLLGSVVVGAWLHAAGAAFSRLPGL